MYELAQLVGLAAKSTVDYLVDLLFNSWWSRLVRIKNTTRCRATKISAPPLLAQIYFSKRQSSSLFSLPLLASILHAHAPHHIHESLCDWTSQIRSSSSDPGCYRESRHPGSAIEYVRRRICGRGRPNGPAKCRAGRRV